MVKFRGLEEGAGQGTTTGAAAAPATSAESVKYEAIMFIFSLRSDGIFKQVGACLRRDGKKRREKSKKAHTPFEAAAVKLVDFPA